MNRVCLVMVLGDEGANLRRCLESVRRIIDHWVICDAGSADGTRAVVEECLKGIPGEFHEVAWVDAGRNWTEALRLARGKGDYHLVLDAEMILEPSQPSPRPSPIGMGEGELTAVGKRRCGGLESTATSEAEDELMAKLAERFGADSYLLKEQGETDCWVERLISDRHEWRFVGAARPFLHSNTAARREKFPDFTIKRQVDAEVHAARCRADVELLKQAIERGANVARATFHLAQCYRDLGNLPLAIEYYEKRATMGGWAEEVWYSIYQVARLQQRLGISWVLVLNQYLRAYEFRPTRIEPLFHVTKFYRENGQGSLARLFGAAGLEAEYPDDLLFIEREVYQGGLETLICEEMEPLSETEPLSCSEPLIWR